MSEWVALIRQQFQQTPHLRVTAEQASRLWGLETAELEAVLSAFVDAHLLNRTRSGAFVLRSDSDTASPTNGLGFTPRDSWQGCAHL